MAEVEVGAVAPVVNAPVAAEVATPAPEVTATPETQVEKPEASEPEKTLTQSEVNKLVAKEKAQAAKRAEKLAMERFRAEAAERELAQLRAERDKPPQPQGKPQWKEFEAAGKTPEEFVEAVSDWKVREALAAQAQESQTQRQQRESFERLSQMREAILSGSDEFEDFESVVFADDVPITPPMAHAIAEIEGIAPAKVAYYLGTHPEEALRISKLKSTRQAVEIDALAKKLAAPPKPTSAPAPIVPNVGSKSSIPTGYSPTMTDAQYAKWREAQRKAKRESR